MSAAAARRCDGSMEATTLLALAEVDVQSRRSEVFAAGFGLLDRSASELGSAVKP
jgi:hypothetical protein